MDWILSNKEGLWLAFTTIVTLASIIAKLTPSKVDDKWVGKILKILSLNK